MQTLSNTITRMLQNKLQNLVSFLSQVTQGFESLAEEIDNASLRSALRAIAIESKQYAKEISNQFRQFEIKVTINRSDLLWKQIEGKVNEQASRERGGEIVALCNNCEVYFNKLYSEVLQENLPEKTCKDIISYQLYAINCALMKIKLLNATRFNQQIV